MRPLADLPVVVAAGPALGRVFRQDENTPGGPARTHRRTAIRPWESQSGWRRASEARRRSRSGAPGNGRDLGAARTRVPENGQWLGCGDHPDAGGDRRRQPHDASHAARRWARDADTWFSSSCWSKRCCSRLLVACSGCCCARDAHLSLDAARQPGAAGGGNFDRCTSAPVRVGSVDSQPLAHRRAAGSARRPVRPQRRAQGRRARRHRIRWNNPPQRGPVAVQFGRSPLATCVPCGFRC